MTTLHGFMDGSYNTVISPPAPKQAFVQKNSILEFLTTTPDCKFFSDLAYTQPDILSILNKPTATLTVFIPIYNQSILKNHIRDWLLYHMSDNCLSYDLLSSSPFLQIDSMLKGYKIQLNSDGTRVLLNNETPILKSQVVGKSILYFI